MKKRTRLFVISGPSGSGKTTLCNELLKKGMGLMRSLSMTTRLPRRGERPNSDYIYISEEEFKKRIREKEFLEYARFFSCYYGTPKAQIIKALKRGRDVLLSIDVQGAAQLKKAFGKRAVLIFILPPSFGALKKRLLARSSDTEAQIETRLKVALGELRRLNRYDYAVVNDDMKETISSLEAIVKAERCRVEREEEVWQRLTYL